MKKIIKLKRLNISDRQRILKSTTKKNGYVIIRGLFEKKRNFEKFKKKLKNLEKNKDNSSLAGSLKQIFSNCQKLCIGSSSSSGEKIYRFHRIIYNPVWSENVYGLREIFLKFNKIRNIVLGV